MGNCKIVWYKGTDIYCDYENSGYIIELLSHSNEGDCIDKICDISHSLGNAFVKEVRKNPKDVFILNIYINGNNEIIDFVRMNYDD